MVNAVIFAAVLATAPALPNDAERYLPILSAEINRSWAGLTPKTFPAGVVEQESLWKLNATLQTPRELGCGFGQFTKAFNADGSVRFDALEETKRLDPTLANWSWRDCANAQFQLRALVTKLRVNDTACIPLMKGNINAKLCAAAAYNGGLGSITRRIRSCQRQENCDAGEWTGHLDRQCPQAQTKVKGYGEDFCTINSRYPGRVFARMPKYEGKL